MVDDWGESWIKEVLEKGEKQIILELRDYWNLMDVHSKILDLITNGKMSKTTYTYEAIEEVFRETQEETSQSVHLGNKEESSK